MLSVPSEVPTLSVPARPMDAATAPLPSNEDSVSHRWSPWLRVCFRLGFCYFLGYCLLNGNATIFQSIPVWGDKIQDFLANTLLLPAQFLAQHLFHVPSPGDKIHPTGSGDTAINWIAHLILLVLALLAAGIWSGLDRRRPHYQTLSAWLRFLIRLTLGFGMLTYGLVKLFPLQMPVPSMASLAEPLGMHSPMAVLWAFIGMNPVYEMICGTAELIGGILLLFRRTALLGALVTAFVVTNVVLYNFCFDVPVKLYSVHLLLLALFVTLPDAGQLIRFFWLHQPAAPTGIWVPPATRPWFRRTTIGIEVGFALLALGGSAYGALQSWRTTHAARVAPSPLRGVWRIDSATSVGADGNPSPHPVYSADHRPFTELDIDSNVRAAFRDDAGALSYFKTKIDPARHTVQFIRPDSSTISFEAITPDTGHLTLTPIGTEAHTASKLSFSRVSPSGGYPLMNRGFHWISEYPYQR